MKFRNILFVVVLGLIITPQITFAAWWNPASWGIFSFLFSSAPKSQTVSTSTIILGRSDVSTTTDDQPIISTSTIATSTKQNNEVTTKSLPKVVKPVVNAQIPQPALTAGTLCNGKYYSECQSDQRLICPQNGNAYCQIPIQQPPVLVTATTSATTSPSITPAVDKGTPYKGQDGNWYYPNAYDANGRNLQVIMPTPRLVVTVDPENIKYRGTTTVSWTAKDATSCTLDSSPVLLSPTGSQTTGSLGQSTTYKLTCTGKDWTDSESATVTVQPPVLPPPGSYCGGAMLVGRQIDECAREYPDMNW